MLAHLVLSLGFAVAPSSSATPEPVPAISELVVELKEATSPRRGRPVDAVRALRAVERLGIRYEHCGRRDQKTIVKHLGRVLEVADDPALREVAMLSARVLGTFGDGGTGALTDRIDDRKYSGDHEFQRRLILSLGRTQDEEALEELLRCLHHPEPAIQAAGAEALGEFENLEQDRRKDVFYALLQRLVTAKNEVEHDRFDVTHAKHTYDSIVGAVNSSLQRLSGHEELDEERWTRFWNKHKKDDWDAKRP